MAAAVGRKTRLTGWALEARDAEMLRAADAGMTAAAIARKFGTSARHVERRLAAAREAADAAPIDPAADPPWVGLMTPLFPIQPLTPVSTCAHNSDIERGSYLYCPICHQSGMDHRAALRRDPRTDPKPEPTKQPPAAAAKTAALTRRDRRAARRAAETA